MRLLGLSRGSCLEPEADIGEDNRAYDFVGRCRPVAGHTAPSSRVIARSLEIAAWQESDSAIKGRVGGEEGPDTRS